MMAAATLKALGVPSLLLSNGISDVPPVPRRRNSGLRGSPANWEDETTVAGDRGSVMSSESAVSLRTLDGLHLAGTLVSPDTPAGHAVVFVHGGGVTREEGGFFTRLGGAGVASLRYDLRGHRESGGRQEDNVLTAHLNDIRVALAGLRERAPVSQVSLIGASFGGGLAAYYAAKRPGELTRLVLLNPQLDYKDPYIDQKLHWSPGGLEAWRPGATMEWPLAMSSLRHWDYTIMTVVMTGAQPRSSRHAALAHTEEGAALSKIGCRGFEIHHNQHRPHRSLDAAAPLKPLPEPVNLDRYRVRRQTHTACLINEYRLVA